MSADSMSMEVSSTTDKTNVKRIPTEKELASVSRLIGTNFQVIGADLGLDNVKIQQIMMNNHNDAQTQILQMLVTWKQKFNKEATVEELLKVLENNNIDMTKANAIFGL